VRDLEITWASERREKADVGEGTFVVVRHIADTSRASVPGASSEGDSVLLGVVVRPAPRFSKTDFCRAWVPCLVAHFDLDPQLTGDLNALVSNEPAPTERGCWWSRILSLAEIRVAEDFGTGFADPLVAKAVELARPPL